MPRRVLANNAHVSRMLISRSADDAISRRSGRMIIRRRRPRRPRRISFRLPESASRALDEAAKHWRRARRAYRMQRRSWPVGAAAGADKTFSSAIIACINSFARRQDEMPASVEQVSHIPASVIRARRPKPGPLCTGRRSCRRDGNYIS